MAIDSNVNIKFQFQMTLPMKVLKVFKFQLFDFACCNFLIDFSLGLRIVSSAKVFYVFICMCYFIC